jgi:threonine dehydrogenase-like Zn-dependent dehydrogenase
LRAVVLRGGGLAVRQTPDPVPGPGELLLRTLSTAICGVLEAVAAGRLDPLPSVGRVITLDDVPEALDLARKSDGPPRIVVHPNGDVG